MKPEKKIDDLPYLKQLKWRLSPGLPLPYFSENNTKQLSTMKLEVKNSTAPLLISLATQVSKTTVVNILKNITDSIESIAQLNLLANDTAGFDSNTSESTNWITVAAVGTVAVLGGLAIVVMSRSYKKP